MVSYPFERFLNVRAASGASMRHDFGRMGFLTDITGTHQLWTIDRALGWPEQLTFGPERVQWARYSPTEPHIAFGQDRGGNEETLVYLIDDEGGLARRLSPCDAKHLGAVWRPDGRRIAWSHNGRNGRDFDVYVYDPGRAEERLVLEGEGYNWVADWVPGTDRLIIAHANSNVDMELSLIDTVSGELRALTPHEGEALFDHVTATPDGRGAYLASDLGRDASNLAFLDLSSGELRFLEERPWDCEGIDVSDDGRYLTTLTNEDGYTLVEIRDLDSGKVTTVEGLPRGVADAPRYAAGLHRFTLMVAAPDDTPDLWVVDAASVCAELVAKDARERADQSRDEVERWTRSSTAGIPRQALARPELVHFHSFDELRVPAFYFRPKGGVEPHPVVIDIHGGPESQRRPGFSAVVQYLVQEGFGVLSPNVRGSSGYGRAYMALDDVRKRMDSVADLKAAYEWLVSEGGADAERIGLIGGSYGGFMVLSAMVTYPDLWAAGVDIVGVANLVTFLENTADYRRHLREAEYGSLADDRDFLEEISPLTHIDRIEAPLMVIHGRNDPRVPVSEAEQVVEALEARGVEVECLIYDDEGHGLARRYNRLDAYPRVAHFFHEHLRAKPSQGSR